MIVDAGIAHIAGHASKKRIESQLLHPNNRHCTRNHMHLKRELKDEEQYLRGRPVETVMHLKRELKGKWSKRGFRHNNQHASKKRIESNICFRLSKQYFHIHASKKRIERDWKLHENSHVRSTCI